MQKKIVYAGANGTSFRQAAEHLQILAELNVSQKQVQRLTRRLGDERVAERRADVAAFLELSLVDKHKNPKGVSAPSLAVIEVDGGRLQIRDAPADEEEEQNQDVRKEADNTLIRETRSATDPPPAPSPTPVSEASAEAEAKPQKPAGKSASPEASAKEKRSKHWREDRIALLAAMDSEVHERDPFPEIPEHFVEPTRILKLARELKPVPVGEGAPGEVLSSSVSASAEEALQEKGYEPPEVVERRVLASRECWQDFAPQVATGARGMGLLEAERKAFVADGAETNWKLQRRYFGSFVPILDFIHALSYLYASAMAGRTFVLGWPVYVRWISWLWAGKVSDVLKELSERQKELGDPVEDDSESSARKVVWSALRYLQNNQDKMRYDEYRRDGLPITSSLVESLIKEMNYRVKGTEKLWCVCGAEPILQLRADYLSDDKPMVGFWERRQAGETGQRRYRKIG